MTIPKPVFSGFTVFWAVFTLKTRKLPDLSGRQIRQLLWQRKKDSNPHKRSQSPVCYHYTIPLCANDIIQDFWNLSSLFFAFSVSLILWAPKTAGCGKRLVSTSAFHFGTMRFHARPTHIGSVLFRCFGQFFSYLFSLFYCRICGNCIV